MLFDYQTAAVKIAAHHLNKRGGVLIGDVVGLGKTLHGDGLATVFRDDHFTETLILCPKNLVKMWEDYARQFRFRAHRCSRHSRVQHELPTSCAATALVLIDETHNLRNREGTTYHAIREYLEKNESKVILLTATPYNKTYLDLSSQLRLFVPEEQDIGIRPEALLRESAKLSSASSFRIRRSTRSPHSSKVHTRTIGAKSCASSWCAARARSSSATTQRRTTVTDATSSRCKMACAPTSRCAFRSR